MSWGNFFGKIAEQFQSRVERLKNDRDRLVNEEIKLINGVCDEKTAARLLIVRTRIDELNKLLANSAK